MIPSKKISFAALVCLWTIYRISQMGFHFNDPIFILNELIRPIIILVLISIASSPKTSELSFKTILGLFLSFGGLYLFKAYPTNYIPLVWIFYVAANLFYACFLLLGLASLGRNFGLLPALRGISNSGAFNYVRHPVYSSYLHLMFSFSLMFPSFLNWFSLLVVSAGCFIRISLEEEILGSQEEYKLLIQKVRNKVFHPFLTLPLFVLAVVLVFSFFIESNSRPISHELKVISVSPIQTLNPSDYDEWGAVFIGNHIYPRLLPDDHPERSIAIGSLIEKSCIESSGNSCKKEKFLIAIKEMKSCSGSLINAKIVQSELKIILTKKSWLFSNWSFCPSKNKTQICLEFKNTDDVERRLKSVYLRHGWSIEKETDTVLGVAPYCFTQFKRDPNGILFGKLIPTSHSIPEIFFNVSTGEDGNFDLAIYGSDELLKGTKKKLIAHTPSGFFMVSNPKFKSSSQLAWNSIMTFDLIKKFLNKQKLIIDSGDEFDSILPKGKALGSNTKAFKEKATLLIPNFIPGCDNLINNLNTAWKNKGYLNTIAICDDISKFIPEKILGPNPNWDGFIAPLTPGGYFRNAMGDQYFSKTSSESWVKGSSDPENYFYRIGLAQSFLVGSEKICNIKPNPLGLSDMLVSDLDFCK